MHSFATHFRLPGSRALPHIHLLFATRDCITVKLRSLSTKSQWRHFLGACSRVWHHIFHVFLSWISLAHFNCHFRWMRNRLRSLRSALFADMCKHIFKPESSSARVSDDVTRVTQWTDSKNVAGVGTRVSGKLLYDSCAQLKHKPWILAISVWQTAIHTAWSLTSENSFNFPTPVFKNTTAAWVFFPH